MITSTSVFQRDSGAQCIAVSGSSGFVGQALITRLIAEGHAVVRVLRGERSVVDQPQRGFAVSPTSASRELAVSWDFRDDEASLERMRDELPTIDAWVHLGGASVADARWTDERKSEIYASRIGTTRAIAALLQRLQPRPKTFVCASGIGFYGDGGEAWLDETTPEGKGFLAEVCRGWESAAQLVGSGGIRACQARFGAILGKDGGALAKMLPVFRLGLGGPLGSGTQWFSWISLHDAVSGLLWMLHGSGAPAHASASESAASVGAHGLSGPVNVVSPQPVRQGDFARALAAQLQRPSVLPAPAWSLRVGFGQLADEMLLVSQRVRPTRLKDSGFSWRDASLEAALRHALA